MRILVSRIVFHRKGARRASICSSMSGDIGVDAGDSAHRVREQDFGDGRRDARLTFGPTHFTVALPVLYLEKRGRLKVRIHGRPRSDRKRSFLLSAVAPSTSTRHPREARPINWAQHGGLASGGKYSPDAEATFHRAIMHAW